jgi:microcystin-dependent protein
MKKHYRKLLKIVLGIVLAVMILLILYFIYKNSKKENYTSAIGPNNIVLTDDKGNLSQINFPTGMVIMWSGKETNVPQGWAICDGKNGTPDLRGRFVIGTDPDINDDTAPGYFGSFGGSETTSVTFTTSTIPSHKHGSIYQLENNYSCEGSGGSGCVCGSVTIQKASDSGAGLLSTPKPFVIPIRPPYYTVCYIMKIANPQNITLLPGYNNIVLSDDNNTLSAINFPDGVIMMWKGAVNNIPQGWNLCDSSNNTPDLRGRFIVGANLEGPTNNPDLSTYKPRDTGGSQTSQNTLTVANIPRHTHNETSVNDPDDNGCHCDSGNCLCRFSYNHVTDDGKSDGLDTQPVVISTVPPYYVLCYIIKNTVTVRPMDITSLPGPNFDNLLLCDDSGNMSSVQFPTGIICNYNGDATTIPQGWAICNGQNDTPDLRARFTVGVNTGTERITSLSLYDVSNTGGSSAISVTLAKNQLPPHTHGGVVNGNEQTCKCAGGSSYCGGKDGPWGVGNNNYYTGTTTATGGGRPVSFPILPPYYTLSFIMKV